MMQRNEKYELADGDVFTLVLISGLTWSASIVTHGLEHTAHVSLSISWCNR